jgi:hypothetical protein
MWLALAATPLLPGWRNPLTYWSLDWHRFGTKNLLSQPFQSAKVVVIDVASGWFELHSNFVQNIALHKKTPSVRAWFLEGVSNTFCRLAFPSLASIESSR